MQNSLFTSEKMRYNMQYGELFVLGSEKLYLVRKFIC